MTRLLFGLLILLGFGCVPTTVSASPNKSDFEGLDAEGLEGVQETPLQSLPSNCYYLNLWSYYLRWNGLIPIDRVDQPPYGPNTASDSPLLQEDTYLHCYR